MQHFDTVEINNSFYKLPKVEMLKGGAGRLRGFSFFRQSQSFPYPQQEVERAASRAGEFSAASGGFGQEAGADLVSTSAEVAREC